MKKLLFVGLISLFHATAYCQFVQFNLDAELLKTAGGTAMPTTGIVILVASTFDGIFAGPNASEFVPAASDDILLGKWELQASAVNMPGVLAAVGTGSLTLTGTWDQGDPVQMYWFPTLTIGSAAPGSGTSYGQYRDAIGIDTSEVWTTPAGGGGGSIQDLKFFTSDATFLHAGSSLNPASAGNASLTTVPEPSEYAMIFGMLCFAGALVRRGLQARSARL